MSANGLRLRPTAAAPASSDGHPKPAAAGETPISAPRKPSSLLHKLVVNATLWATVAGEFVPGSFLFPILWVISQPVRGLLRFSPLEAACAFIGKTIIWAAGVRLTSTGQENFWITPKDAPGGEKRLKGPYLIMFNHTSNIDPPVLVACSPVPLRFVSKKSLLMVPFLGWLMYWMGNTFINRKDAKSAIAALQGVSRRIRKSGESYALSPEGTRKKREASVPLLPFKKGPFHVALESEGTIIPTVIYGGSELQPADGNSQLLVEPGPLSVRFMPAVAVDPKVDTVDGLIEKVQESMLRGLAMGPVPVFGQPGNEAGGVLRNLRDWSAVLHMCVWTCVAAVIVACFAATPWSKLPWSD